MDTNLVPYKHTINSSVMVIEPMDFQPSVKSANSSVEAKKQTFSSFDDLLANSKQPVLVDFYATWCGPCQYMVPVLNQVSAELKDKIQLVKIDTEKYPKIADQYKIEALPTFIIFRDGKPCDRFEGALTAEQLIQRIETALDDKQK
ncbi:Thioredoxin [Macleaya cordata]|uniref:Thioredoxin n=1 Tax=Macleaya cordata TaxID=56857 RepID=A0A200PPW9_MACCD|nr:Thioredoxin [Macleaya cordata]